MAHALAVHLAAQTKGGDTVKMKHSETPSVPYEVAKARALDQLPTLDDVTSLKKMPATPATIAHHIWPEHQMHAQGAGGAAARVLRKMEKEGLTARWCGKRYGRNSWGWVRL